MSAHPDSIFYRKMQVIGALTFVLFAVAAGLIYVRSSATNQERNDTKATFHAVICSIEETAIKTAKSPDQAQAIATFYNHLLTTVVGTTPCNPGGTS